MRPRGRAWRQASPSIYGTPSDTQVVSGVGECIYCSRADCLLTTEHAVPYAINGNWTLLRASCEKCADETHRFERDTLRGLLPAIRTVFSMQTRRRKARPAGMEVVVESDEEQKSLLVPICEFPTYLPNPLFPTPRILTGDPSPRLEDTQLEFRHVAGPTFEDFALAHPDAEFVGARLRFQPESFARTLAKIAYCAAVYVVGIQGLRRAPIRDIILGRDRDVLYRVGGWYGEPITERSGLHSMQVRAVGTEIHVFLRLFAQFGAPEYHVVLGHADEAFVKSDLWPWP